MRGVRQGTTQVQMLKVLPALVCVLCITTDLSLVIIIEFVTDIIKSCSVACNKIHRETHPADATPQVPKPVPRPRLAGAGMQKAGTRADVHATLAASEQLKYLFQKYPRLQSQLLEIHSSVFQTDSDPRIPASMRTSVQSTSQWDKAKGLHRGREALAKARNAQDGEGLREYTELVIYMLHEAERQNNKPEANADQASQDVTKLLEQLLTPSK